MEQKETWGAQKTVLEARWPAAAANKMVSGGARPVGHIAASRTAPVAIAEPAGIVPPPDEMSLLVTPGACASKHTHTAGRADG